VLRIYILPLYFPKKKEFQPQILYFGTHFSEKKGSFTNAELKIRGGQLPHSALRDATDVPLFIIVVLPLLVLVYYYNSINYNYYNYYSTIRTNTTITTTTTTATTTTTTTTTTT